MKNVANATVVAVTLLGLGLSQSTDAGYPDAPDVHPELSRMLQMAGETRETEPMAGLPKRLELVGFLNLGITSDVWAHDDVAYVAGLLVDGGPAPTVKLVDVSDPEDPRLIVELPAPPGSSPQDVKVAKIRTDFFRGDLLVVGNDGGEPPAFGGVQLWDVSDPESPLLLSEPRIGPVHNTFLYQADDRAFVLLAIPFAEAFTAFLPPFVTFGDFVIVEVTDPRNPEVIADWGAGKDGGFPFGADFPGFPVPCGDPMCRGGFPAIFCHDVWANKKGTVAYLSYWDLGLVLLDISDPAHPTFIGRGEAPLSDDGDLHNAVPARGGKLVITGDEDFDPVPWGFMRIFDTSDPDSPVQSGTFATDRALNDPVPSFDFPRSIHNVVVKGNKAFISWYAEGIRVVDVGSPSNPRELAAFVPPPETGSGVFWGVFEDHDLIFGSDIFSGLFILELTDNDEPDDDSDSD